MRLCEEQTEKQGRRGAAAELAFLQAKGGKYV